MCTYYGYYDENGEGLISQVFYLLNLTMNQYLSFLFIENLFLIYIVQGQSRKPYLRKKLKNQDDKESDRKKASDASKSQLTSSLNRIKRQSVESLKSSFMEKLREGQTRSGRAAENKHKLLIKSKQGGELKKFKPSSSLKTKMNQDGKKDSYSTQLDRVLSQLNFASNQKPGDAKHKSNEALSDKAKSTNQSVQPLEFIDVSKSGKITVFKNQNKIRYIYNK